MRRLGFAVLVLVAASMIAAAAAGGESTHSRAPTPHAAACGKERWRVKTLSDKRRFWVHLHQVNATTVDALRRKKPPSPTGESTPRRRGVETTVYRVHARLVEYKLEDDSDIHLVIKRLHAPGTMIVEFPYRGCLARHARARKRMIHARSVFVRRFGAPTTDWQRLHARGVITGVGFFDIPHGQTGVAPNAIELHPVIGFASR